MNLLFFLPLVRLCKHVSLQAFDIPRVAAAFDFDFRVSDPVRGPTLAPSEPAF